MSEMEAAKRFLRLNRNFCTNLLKNETIMQALKQQHFDVVISDSTYWCGPVLQELLEVKRGVHIAVLTFDPVFPEIYASPQQIATLPCANSPVGYEIGWCCCRCC